MHKNIIFRVLYIHPKRSLTKNLTEKIPTIYTWSDTLVGIGNNETHLAADEDYYDTIIIIIESLLQIRISLLDDYCAYPSFYHLT